MRHFYMIVEQGPFEQLVIGGGGFSKLSKLIGYDSATHQTVLLDTKNRFAFVETRAEKRVSWRLEIGLFRKKWVDVGQG